MSVIFYARNYSRQYNYSDSSLSKHKPLESRITHERIEMVKTSTQKKKPLTAQNRGVREQLKCILGACNHVPTSTVCIYWKKVVDCDDPANMQLKLIEKLMDGKKI